MSLIIAYSQGGGYAVNGYCLLEYLGRSCVGEGEMGDGDELGREWMVGGGCDA